MSDFKRLVLICFLCFASAGRAELTEAPTGEFQQYIKDYSLCLKPKENQKRCSEWFVQAKTFLWTVDQVVRLEQDLIHKGGQSFLLSRGIPKSDIQSHLTNFKLIRKDSIIVYDRVQSLMLDEFAPKDRDLASIKKDLDLVRTIKNEYHSWIKKEKVF